MAETSQVMKLRQFLHLDDSTEQSKSFGHHEIVEILRVTAEIAQRIEASIQKIELPFDEFRVMLQRLMMFLYQADRNKNIRKIHFIPFLDVLRLLELLLPEANLLAKSLN